MPSSCCVVDCTNRKSGRPDLVFYGFPSLKKNPRRRQLWKNAVNRGDNWLDEQVDNARICSQHFISGKKSDNPNNPNYVPSIFSYKVNSAINNQQQFQIANKRKRSGSLSQENSNLVPELNLSEAKPDVEESEADQIKRLLAENADLKKENHELKTELKRILILNEILDT